MINQSRYGPKGPTGTETPSGVDSILKERGSTYGDSGVNLRCMNQMLRAYERARDESAANLTEEQRQLLALRPDVQAHEMAVVMIIGKLARIATGVPHADNYDDIIGYTKIAKKHAIGE